MFIDPRMYRRSKFLELLLDIRTEMSAEAEYDVDQLVQNLQQPLPPNAPGGSSETASGLNGSGRRTAARADRKRRIVP